MVVSLWKGFPGVDTRIAVMLCGLLGTIWARPAEAQGDGAAARATLKGLTGVCVVVDSIDAEAQRDGLPNAQIQTDVEVKLREAGIRVLTLLEAGETPGSGFLVLSLYAHADDEGLYAFTVQLKLIQAVRLARNGAYTVGATWSKGGYSGTVGRTKLSLVRNNVRDVADDFINAYLDVNPKK